LRRSRLFTTNFDVRFIFRRNFFDFHCDRFGRFFGLVDRALAGRDVILLQHDAGVDADQKDTNVNQDVSPVQVVKHGYLLLLYRIESLIQRNRLFGEQRSFSFFF